MARPSACRAKASGKVVVSHGYFAEPPHLPVTTLKLPQFIGDRQSAIRSFVSAT
jgi:hypothetical protein